jgi:hypothetical protein
MRKNSTIRLGEPQAANVFVAYDLREAAVRARDLCEHVDEEINIPLQLKLWRFEDIASPAQSNSAAADAEISRMILIAWAQPEGVPASIIGWLENWARRRAIANAVLAALPLEAPADEEYISPTLALLQRIAFENKLSFVDGRERGWGGLLDDFSDGLRLREQTMTPTLEHILGDAHYEPHVQWGIND